MFNNVYKGKRVFVTGHTGFKGSWLSEWLIKLGAEVGGFSKKELPYNPSLFEATRLTGRLEDYRGDIRDYEDLHKALSVFRPEIVFHLAAEPIVRTCYDAPKMAFDTNVGGTTNILECIKNIPTVRSLVLVTSDKCYDNQEWEYGYRENDRLGGKDPYSASKACAELVFHAYHESYFRQRNNFGAASVRAGNVIGGGDWSKDRIVSDCMRAWSQNGTLVTRSPNATRPWQHVLEPLSGYMKLGAELYTSGSELTGHSFNFGPHYIENITVGQLISDLAATWGNGKWEIDKNVDRNKKEHNLLKLCCDKALAKLSWKGTLSYKETVTMTAQWFMAYYSGKTDMANFTLNQIEQYEKMYTERI